MHEELIQVADEKIAAMVALAERSIKQQISWNEADQNGHNVIALAAEVSRLRALAVPPHSEDEPIPDYEAAFDEMVGTCPGLTDDLRAENQRLKRKNVDLQQYEDEQAKEIEDHAFLCAKVKRVTRHVADGQGIHVGRQFDSLMDDVRSLASVTIDPSPVIRKHRELEAELVRLRDSEGMLRIAATALITRLKEIEGPINAFIGREFAHNGTQYTGPNWGKPLIALELALSQPESPAALKVEAEQKGTEC